MSYVRKLYEEPEKWNPKKYQHILGVWQNDNKKTIIAAML